MDKHKNDELFMIQAISRDREYVFVFLMILLTISMINIFIDRDLLKYYKYMCWITLPLATIWAFFRSDVRQLPTAGTIIAIFFAFVGILTVGIAQMSTGISFGSALIPFLVTGLGYLSLGQGALEVQRFVTMTYVVCGAVFIAGLIAPPDEFFRINEFSFVLVFGLVFSMVTGSRFATLLILFVVAVVIILRPTSTLVLGTSVGLALASISARRPQLAAMLSCIVIFIFAIMAVASMSDPQLAYALGDVEAYLKESILGGESNSNTRAALIMATQQNFEESSFFFGNFFLGETNPDVSDILGRLDFTAPVHSDFVQMLYQGGFLGLLAFCYFLVELTALHFAPYSTPDGHFLQRAVPACTAVFALYISFNPIMLNIEYSLWFFMLSFICLGLPPRSRNEEYPR